MKRTIPICILLLLGVILLACAAQEPETRELIAVSAPGEQDVTLLLPLTSGRDATKLLKGYTDGFVSGSGKLLTFTTETENPEVALSSLFEDGTLCILAEKEGKTTVLVTAINETGEEAIGRVNVTVKSSRRVGALILLGVLAVTLFILFGKPNAKKAEPQPEPEQTAMEEQPESAPQEAEQTYEILPERSSNK